MSLGRTIFAQWMDHLLSYEFRKCLARYRGDYKLRGFSCCDQFLCLAFAQLTYRESLRDIEACLYSAQSKLYLMGIRGKASRSTLAQANEANEANARRIYADFAQVLIDIARPSLEHLGKGIHTQHSASARQTPFQDHSLDGSMLMPGQPAARTVPRKRLYLLEIKW